MKRSAFVGLLAALSLGCTALLASPLPSFASGAHHTTMSADAIEWGAPPPSLPPGAQAAILFGHPGKEGPFVMRLKLPAGFVVPPHRHSKDESVTVISGRFSITSGDKIDRASVKPLPAASFFHMPAGMTHYAIAEADSVVQIHGMGPFDVIYVDPKDDPRKK